MPKQLAVLKILRPAAVVAMIGALSLAPTVRAGNVNGDHATAFTGNGVVTVQAQTTNTNPATNSAVSSSGVT